MELPVFGPGDNVGPEYFIPRPGEAGVGRRAPLEGEAERPVSTPRSSAQLREAPRSSARRRDVEEESEIWRAVAEGARAEPRRVRALGFGPGGRSEAEGRPAMFTELNAPRHCSRRLATMRRA
ncbi:hypothetical protein KM043_001347 [Ampulex compressa]|nr:hypothetical protein KM043_001347 [Ampulex compressa]